MTEIYIYLSISVVTILVASLLFSFFAESCKAIHSKISTAEKVNKKKKR